MLGIKIAIVKRPLFLIEFFTYLEHLLPQFDPCMKLVKVVVDQVAFKSHVGQHDEFNDES